VLREGRVVLELGDGELDEEAVLRAALGSRNGGREGAPAPVEAGEASAAGPGRTDDAAR
jgi:hypothetical protein